jgi:UPF0042 nucleotide-binding protein
VRALVFGQPGSGTELATRELRRAGFEADGWDGTEPNCEAQDAAALDSGHWPLLLRLECTAPICAGRYGPPWLSPNPPLPPAILLSEWEARRERQTAARLRSTLVVDSTRLTPDTLCRRLAQLPLQGVCQPRTFPVVVLESFGYPAGIPLDMDWCVDARQIRNPYWEPELRERNGLDPLVQAFVLEQESAQRLLEGIEGLVASQLPSFMEPRLRQRLVLRLAIGCTGGFHRSVAMVEELSRRLGERGVKTMTWHRDLGLSK